MQIVRKCALPPCPLTPRVQRLKKTLEKVWEDNDQMISTIKRVRDSKQKATEELGKKENDDWTALRKLK